MKQFIKNHKNMIKDYNQIYSANKLLLFVFQLNKKKTKTLSTFLKMMFTCELFSFIYLICTS